MRIIIILHHHVMLSIEKLHKSHGNHVTSNFYVQMNIKYRNLFEEDMDKLTIQFIISIYVYIYKVKFAKSSKLIYWSNKCSHAMSKRP